MLQLREVHTFKGDSHILQGVSMEVPRGAVIALLGRNGMGKTLLFPRLWGFKDPAVAKYSSVG